MSSFVGKSSEKFNSQVTIFNMDIEFPVGKQNLDYSERNDALKKLRDRRLGFLNENRANFSNESIQILKLNTKYQYLLWNLSMIDFDIRSNDPEPKVIAKKYAAYFLRTLPPNETGLMNNSYVYMDYLLKKERLKLIIAANVANGNEFADFGNLFHVINSNYTGSLRDMLLLKEYTSMNTLNDNRKDYLDSIKKIVRDPYVKGELDNFVSKFLRGAVAFNFKLLDTAGKFVSLSDFKGKVVVLDYYYTGCTGCAALTAAMKPVVEEFKDTPNLVFISINLDKTMEKFKKAVRAGKYTHSSSVNLYTNGEAWNHKLISYYNIWGAPCLMIIDSKGNMFDGNPPRPNYNMKEETMKFISQINQALKE